MTNLNNTTDVDKYLQTGKLTQPFLDNNYVLERVMRDYNAKLKLNGQANKLESLYLWIDKNVEICKDKEFCDKYKFQRTAKEIWESKKMMGCTDYCLLFATFARQIGIPTTFLHTAEKNWIERLKNNENSKIHYGHSFCECFYNNEWVLVDPTVKKIQTRYNPNHLILNYTIGGNNEFVSYLRDLDLDKKQSVKKHNEIMDSICLGL